MAGPMYYFPGFGGTSFTDQSIKDKVKECGLDIVLSGAEFVAQSTTTGPDHTEEKPSLGGLVIAVKKPVVPNVGYYPDDQEWLFIKPKGYWLGFKKGCNPTPSDLQRRETLWKDYEVRLCDGNDWAVMAIRPFARQGSIPRVGKMDENCEWTWTPRSEFDELLKKYEDVFAGGQRTMAGWADLAIDTLSVNYRIDVYLAMALGLVEFSHCEKIVDLATDEPEFRAHTEAKKRGIERSGVSVTSYGELVP